MHARDHLVGSRRGQWVVAARLQKAESLKTAVLEPREPFWPSMELQLRSGISAVLLGQKTAKVALDGVAEDWKRSLRRAGVKQG